MLAGTNPQQLSPLSPNHFAAIMGFMAEDPSLPHHDRYPKRNLYAAAVFQQLQKAGVPANATAFRHLINCHAQAGHMPFVRACIQRMQAAGFSVGSPAVEVLVARTLIVAGNVKEGVHLHKKAAASMPDEQGWDELVQSYAYGRHIFAMEKLIREGVAIGFQLSTSALCAITSACVATRYNKALPTYMDIAKERGVNFPTSWTVARMHASRTAGDDREVIRIFNAEVMRLKNITPEMYSLAIQAYARLGEHDNAWSTLAVAVTKIRSFSNLAAFNALATMGPGITSAADVATLEDTLSRLGISRDYALPHFLSSTALTQPLAALWISQAVLTTPSRPAKSIFVRLIIFGIVHGHIEPAARLVAAMPIERQSETLLALNCLGRAIQHDSPLLDDLKRVYSEAMGEERLAALLKEAADFVTVLEESDMQSKQGADGAITLPAIVPIHSARFTTGTSPPAHEPVDPSDAHREPRDSAQSRINDDAE
ncbi:hypothetical protein HK105_202723 [Polyrhizophydium stewartii]|uniref:Pentatricopeptide repeat-containing protein n=1 Tax=Polyrhizophydium stewartii TaxID=2732419 RepID=A0ABR4NEB8_9FUNG|nr:hypothetical protein HK105_001067 [Polyrhizophydium stewartii]